MLQRIRELAVQAANDTNTKDDRTALQNEATALSSEITRIADNTQWNGMQIFKGTAASAVGTAGAAKFQVSANSTGTPTIDVDFSAQGLDAKSLVVEAGTGKDIDFATQATSTTTIGKVDAAIKLVDAERAKYGSAINRLTYAADNLTNVSQNTSASRSRIRDTDYATATTELARTQIISQAATAMLAQANQQPQSVLTLLR